MQNTTNGANVFGSLLQDWRRLRKISQMELAGEAGVSSRHVGFIEIGRARPSREMVLMLAAALDVPLRERNAMLTAAGFAPIYGEADLDAPDLAHARQALDFILRQQEPFPAVAMNRHWDILVTNKAAERFFATLLQGSTPPEPANIVRLMFHPDGLRPHVANWEPVAEALIQRIHREAVAGVKDEATRALIGEVLDYPGVAAGWRKADPAQPLQPILPIEFRKGDLSARYFSTVTVLGTPQDVTLQEIRIECFFPADEETERFARTQAE
jgi:transcriptional regulator with XRE-family HTH domain